MSLTRHLYREDEVKISFFNCLVNRRVEESLFWATELFDSFLGEEILPIFKKAWLFSVGPEYRKGFLQVVALEEEKEVYQALQNFMSLPKDASVFTLLVRGASCESQPDRLCRKPSIVREGLDEVDRAAWRAISRRKPLLALCLLREGDVVAVYVVHDRQLAVSQHQEHRLSVALEVVLAGEGRRE